MSHAFNGSTSKLVLSSALVAAVPLTMACFFKPNSTSTNQTLLVADDLTSSNRFLLFAASTAVISARTTQTTNGTASTTETYTLNRWQSAAMVTGAVASRYAALNGRVSVEETTSKTPTGISEFEVGNVSGTILNYSGLMAEVAVWAAALTPAELQAFHSGVPAAEIRPRSLLLYMPLTTQLGISDLGPRALILANTAVTPISDHPSIMRPIKRPLRRSRLVFAH